MILWSSVAYAKICTKGQPCGNTCISWSYTCHIGTTTSVPAKISQTIGAIGLSSTTLAVGGTITASATATSGLPVTYTTSTPSVCSVSGSTITGVAAGICTIAANQFGNTSYSAATQATQSITIGQPTQTISFGTAPTVAVGGTGTVTATATSSLPVTYSSLTPSVCRVTGSIVTGLTGGTCTIVASQAGNTSFSAATQATQNITIGGGSQSQPDCLFNWAEQNFAQFFSPAATSKVYTPYYYRYYSDTGNYLAASSTDNHLWVLGPSFGSAPLDVGAITSLLGVSGCQ